MLLDTHILIHSLAASLTARERTLLADQIVARTAPKLDFESDPGDEIIAATSVVHRVPLVTRDRRIR